MCVCYTLLCLSKVSCFVFLFLTFPGGAPTGTLCGEPSAPLRRCQQPLLFPKNPQPELTTIHNSGAALVWNQRQEVSLTDSDRCLFPKQSRSLVWGLKRTQPQINFDSKRSSGKFIGGRLTLSINLKLTQNAV